MTPAQWSEVREILAQVLDLGPEERSARLAGLDPLLRREVEALLAYEEDATEFLSAEALEPMAVEGTAAAPVRVGPYRVLQEIGRGGMGVVYLAQRDDGQFEKKVAIKLLPALFRSAEMERWFKRERDILARLEHPGVARLLDGGVTADGQPFLIMEYVEEGVPLTTWAAESALNLNAKLRLFVEVCAAVSYAHGKLIVHRDLKPSNVLVDSSGHIKLLDFGLARMIGLGEGEDAGGQSQRLIMTPSYASPEQIRGEPLAVTTDVFSLGVMLFELISGRRPFASSNQSTPQVLLAVCQDDPPPPSRLGSGGTPELDFITLKALEKDPARRYASVEALRSDVLAWLEHRPIAARPAGVIYRVGKFVRRHRVGSALGIAALIAVAVTTSLAIRGNLRARRQFDQTRKLANSVLFELHDAVGPLPGSTKARDLIVRRGTEYLDALSREPGVDAGLRRELAKGYLRLGDVTGQSGDSNLGNVKAALESYKKGVALLEGVARELPKDGDISRDLGSAYRLLGYSFIVNENAADGRAAFENALRLSAVADPNQRRGLRTSGLNHFALGFAFTHERNYPKAVEEYSSALRIFEEIVASGNPAGLRDVALCHKRLGGIYGRMADYAKAVASFELACDVDRRVVAANPTSYLARMDLSFSYSDLGLNLQSLKRLPEALDANEKALEIRIARNKEDPSDARAATGVAMSYRRRGEILLAQNNPRKAVVDFAESAHRFQELARTSRFNAEVAEERAFTEYELGQTLAALGRQAEAVTHWKSATDLWMPLAKLDLVPAEHVPFYRELQSHL